MSPRSKGNLAYVVLVGAAVLLIAYRFGAFEVVASEFPVAGEVKSVESSGQNNERVALVQLDSGDVVRASVPAACLVFPGQIAKVYYSGSPFQTGPRYTVLSSVDKK